MQVPAAELDSNSALQQSSETQHRAIGKAVAVVAINTHSRDKQVFLRPANDRLTVDVAPPMSFLAAQKLKWL